MSAARDFKLGVRIHRLAYKPKNAKVGQKGRCLRRVTYFYNFGTLLYISGTDRVRNFKFGVPIDRRATSQKCKTRSKGEWSTSRDLLFKFWDSLYISGTDKVRNFKFGVQVDRRAFKPKKAKVSQKGSVVRHVTYCL